jgi:hypothetical protein
MSKNYMMKIVIVIMESNNFKIKNIRINILMKKMTKMQVPIIQRINTNVHPRKERKKYQFFVKILILLILVI